MKKRCFLGFLSILFSAFLSLNAFAADCAANYYTNANGVCTACPAHSHSNGGDTPTCTCDDGFTITGLTDGDTETTNNACVTISDFVIKTTSIPENAVFLFKLPGGDYTIDWGDGTVEKQTGTMSHTYTTSGEYTIGISGMGKSYYTNADNMDFCGYNNKNVTAGQYIKELGGDLSKMFTKRSSLYKNAFNGCKALTTISGPLFGSVNGSSYAMDEFNSTFKDCTSLTTIPGNLFGQRTVHGPQNFSSTFAGCTSLKEIPSDLFAKITTPAENLFISTFEGSGITSIPSDLFSSFTSVSTGMFQNTFKNCTSLTQLPSDLFAKITTPAENLFISTFEGSGITSIPSDLFSSFTSVSTGMFQNTFKNCKSLRQLPNGLFKNISGEPAGSSFYATFNGANLVGFVPADMFEKLDSTNYKSGAMSYIFQNTGLDNVCPGGMYQYKTGFEIDWSGKVSCKSCPDNGESIQWENSSATLCFKSENFEDMTGRGIIKNYYNETTNSYEPGVREYTQCNANYYLNNASCTACPANSHSNGGDTPTCTCDDGYTVTGLFNDSTETTQDCREISEIGVVWAPVWPLQNSPAQKTCIIGETCTLPTEESISHWHDETTVLKYWKNVDDPTKTYAPGQQIDENTIKTDSPDAWLRLAPVYGCAAGYYGDGTTCTECPANSHRDVGTTVCICDDGYSADGLTVDNTVAPESGCVQVKTFCADYWPSVSGPSGPPPMSQCGLLYGQNNTLFTTDDISSYIPDGYVFSHWADRSDATITFAPGQEVQMLGSLGLRAVYTCAAGYYGDGTTCTICPENSGSYESYGPDQEEKSGMSSCICDYGYSADGNITGATVAPESGCAEMMYGVGYWITSSGPPNVDYRIPSGETDTLLTASDSRFAQYARDGYVLSKWRDRKDATNSRLFDPGQVISVSDLLPDSTWLELVPVYTCAAGYYGDGTTCTPCPENHFCPDGATEPIACPENSTSDVGAEACVVAVYKVTYGSGYQTYFTENVTNGSIYTISSNSSYGSAPGNAVQTGWTRGQTAAVYPFGTEIAYDFKEDIYLQPWYDCIEGYYGPMNPNPTCMPCPAGYTSDVGSHSRSECYLITEPGKAVITANSDQETCPQNNYCVGGQKIIYGDTGGATPCPENSSTNGATGQTFCSCDTGYRMVDNVCEACPDGVCVDPLPMPPTCPDGYHVDELTNNCVGNTLYIEFENGDSYNYNKEDLPTGLSVTHGELVPVLSRLDKIGPEMRYKEDVAAGTAEMDVKNWAFKLGGYDVTAWLADGSVDIGSMGENSKVSTDLFPAEGDLTVYPVWKTIELRCNAGYYNKGYPADIGTGNCTKCPTSGNQICPGMDKFKPINEESGIETCGVHSSPNDERTECVCNPGYDKDTITGICTEKTYTITYDDNNTVDSFNHFGSYTIKAPGARDGYVFDYWVDDNDIQYTAGQTISGSDLTDTYYITLTGVWHCAANYYGNGTTCTPCPEYSTSTEGSDHCTCDAGYSISGVYEYDNKIISSSETCKQIMKKVEFLHTSNTPTGSGVSQNIWVEENYVVPSGKDIMDYYKDKDEYIFDYWVAKNSGETKYYAGTTVQGRNLPEQLYGVWHCAAGYYADGDNCLPCNAGKFCPGDGQSYECPENHFCPDGAADATQCPADDYPYSAAGSVKIDDCYINCEDTPVENGTAYRDADRAPYQTECPYSKGISDAGNACNIIKKDDGGMFCYEPNCRYNQEMLTPGVCTECNVEHADTYDENAHGNCIVKTCDPGYMPYLNECREKEISCTAEHAITAHRHWDEKYLAYGPCLVEECEENYHIDANACESNISPCDIKNGVGEREWQGTNWSECYVKRCERGFIADDDNTQCERCPNYRDEKGDVAVSSYINDKCEIATCMYQGEKYILENNECHLICTYVDNDGTGSRQWNEDTKKCERTCNDGHLPW